MCVTPETCRTKKLSDIKYLKLLHQVGVFIYRFKQLEGRILLILSSSSGCHTLSNARLTSKNTVIKYCWFSVTFSMTPVKHVKDKNKTSRTPQVIHLNCNVNVKVSVTDIYICVCDI